MGIVSILVLNTENQIPLPVSTTKRKTIHKVLKKISAKKKGTNAYHRRYAFVPFVMKTVMRGKQD